MTKISLWGILALALIGFTIFGLPSFATDDTWIR